MCGRESSVFKGCQLNRGALGDMYHSLLLWVRYGQCEWQGQRFHVHTQPTAQKSPWTLQTKGKGQWINNHWSLLAILIQEHTLCWFFLMKCLHLFSVPTYVVSSFSRLNACHSVTGRNRPSRHFCSLKREKIRIPIPIL